MAQEAAPAEPKPASQRPSGWLWLLLPGALLAALALAWSARKPIAEEVIERELAGLDLPARYTIAEIGPGHLLLRDVAVGDPARPDFTADEVELSLSVRFGLPGLDRARLERPRLYASWDAAAERLDFGALNRFIYEDSEEEPSLPDLDLSISDGGGVIESPAGRIGLAISGSGHLRDGFRGEVAAFAPALALSGCEAERVTLHGTAHVDNLEPGFAGPLRLAALRCAAAGLRAGPAVAQLDLGIDRNLEDVAGDYTLEAQAPGADGLAADAIAAQGAASWRDGLLMATYRLAAREVEAEAALAGTVELDGQLRFTPADGRIEVASEVEARRLRPGPLLAAQIAATPDALDGTLAAPLLRQARSALLRALGRGGSASASFTARSGPAGLSVVVPGARLRGERGEALLALSAGRLLAPASGALRFGANFVTGGAGLPRLSGRMEQQQSGALALEVRMADYAAGDARLAIPALRLVQRADGAVVLDGRVRASGAVPGGRVDALDLPLDGTLFPDGRLVLWSGCRPVRFARLELADLAIEREELLVCPPAGRPVLRHGPAGLELAAGVAALELSGSFAGTAARLRSGAVGLAWPGNLAAQDVSLQLGPDDAGVLIAMSRLEARFDAGGAGSGGTFAGLSGAIAAVPLDLAGAAGRWRYADGRLELADTGFTLTDRNNPARFNPLIARGASLSLADGAITAEALLREPASDAAVTEVDIVHRLASGAGTARLTVAGISFGPGLQPATITPLAFGVVADVRGTVTGEGRIDWTPEGVTSTGRFRSASLDLAAAFGPVRGASGEVVFSDLLGLTTAPAQRLRIAAINPGIEVNDGEVYFQLRDGQVLQLDGGRWPYLGGTLTLLPLTITIGAAEQRRWVILVDGLDAARFVENMELSNIAASGLFDGTIPIVFDAEGNGRLEDGRLTSRAPGGHLSYVGQLTYEDLSAVGNFAFSALRDLAYNRAEIVMSGPLTGELVTRVQFDGVRQGATAEQNILTRQLGRLPIRLLVNVRAPFYRLLESMRSLYDPSAVRDPRSLGLITDDGTRFLPAPGAAATGEAPPVQPPASEPRP